MPADDPVQERTVVPEPPAILVEDSVQVRLEELVVTERLTVPENPLIGDTVIVEVPAVPAGTVTLTGLADRVKSGATR